MKKFNSTKELIRSNGYWVLNKNLVQILGLETAFLLSNFADAEDMLSDNEGWFYQTTETVENMTTLSRYKQDQSIKQLEELEVLKKETRGLPPKRYFKIDYDGLTNLFARDLQINMRVIDKSNCKELATSKESTNKESKVHKESIKDIVVSKETDEIPYEEILDYLNLKAKRGFVTKGKRSENNRKFIRLRWNEGNTLNHFKQVVDNMVSIWLGDKKMEQYLQPSTLFGTKFDEYLNKKPKDQPKHHENRLGIKEI